MHNVKYYVWITLFMLLCGTLSPFEWHFNTCKWLKPGFSILGKCKALSSQNYTYICFLLNSLQNWPFVIFDIHILTNGIRQLSQEILRDIVIQLVLIVKWQLQCYIRFELTINIPHLSLAGVCCDNCGENRSCYNWLHCVMLAYWNQAG